MEFVDGKTLADWINEEQPLREGVELIQKVLEALHFAHQQKIIHRDLKPDNILITKEKEPKITDFGLARDNTLDSQQLTQTGAILGTPLYMSPEQSQGEIQSLSPLSDIYSMGVCLYEVVTKKRPYKMGPLHILLYQIAKKEPIPLSHWNIKVHQDLEIILFKSLEKDPSKRYPSAQAFAEDLKCFLEGYPIQAKAATSFEKTLKWVKRNRLLTSLICLTLSISSFFIFYFQWKTTSQKKERHQNLFQQAKNLIDEAERIKENSLKTQALLKSLKLLNQALSINSSGHQVALQKWKIGKELISLACQSQNYQLADHIASDLQTLTFIEPQKQKELRNKINQAKNKRLIEHQKQLRFWLEKLQETSLIKDNIQKNAIFEISKMTEIEIFKQLLERAKKGHLHFLGPSQNITQEKYYLTLIKILGRLENKQAAPFLLKSLQEMVKQNNVVKHISLAKLNYMVEIVTALVNLEIVEYATTLQNIRTQMASQKLFVSRVNPLLTNLLQKTAPDKRSSSDLNTLTNRAQTKLFKGDYQGAIDNLTQLLKKTPKSASLYLNRALAKQRLKEPEGALKDYQQAIQYAYSKKVLSSAYLNRGALKIEMGKRKEALVDFNKSIQINPRFIDALTNRALLKSHLGDLKGAIADINETIKLDPKNAQAYSHRGTFKNQLPIKDFKGALEDFSIAIKLNPKDFNAYNNRGIIKRERKDFKGALEDFSIAIKLNPQHHKSYYNQAKTKKLFGDLEGALLDFNQAIELNPKFTRSYLGRGLVKQQKGDFLGAQKDYNEVLKQDPSFKEAYFYRGIIKQSSQDFKGAVQDYTHTIRLNPKDYQSYVNRGMAKAQQGNFDGAIQDYNLAIELSPHSFEAFRNRGALKQTKSDIPGAIQDYSAAIKLKPREFNLIFNRAQLYFTLNQRAKAKKDFQQFLFLTQNLQLPQVQRAKHFIFQNFPELK